MSAEWFRLDNPTSDGAAALSFVRSRLDEVASGEQTAWRWVVLGVHLALQDFILGSFPNNLYAMDEERALRFIEGMEAGVDGSELPDLRVDWFPNLYRRMKEVTGYESGGEIDELIIGPDEDGGAPSLHALRNGLVHHFPGGWSIHVPALLDCVWAALTVIGHLGWERQYTNHVFWLDDDVRERARSDLDRSVEQLGILRAQVGSNSVNFG